MVTNTQTVGNENCQLNEVDTKLDTEGSFDPEPKSEEPDVQARLEPKVNSSITETALPNGYNVSDEGLTVEKYHINTKKCYQEIICYSPIKLTGSSRDIDTGEISYEVSYTDSLGHKCKSMYMQSELISAAKLKQTPLANQLNMIDTKINDLCKYFNRYINEYGKTLPSTDMANKYGWRKEETFIIGSKMINKDGVTPINSLQNTEKYETKGSRAEWTEGVKSVIDDKTVRIKCYAASAAPLLKLFNVQSYILDHYGPTSMGKTFGDQVAISIFGDPKALLIPGNSSESHIEMQATLATDLPIVIDETSLADPVVLTRIVYMINNEGSRGRATNAKLQEINRWRIVCLTTGEDTIIKTNLNGAGVRAISFNIPMKVMDAGEIENCRGIIEHNYGHIIDLYMAKVFQNKDKIKKQFLEVRKHYVKNGQSTALNRMGSYFAIMEIAGSILEDVFKDIGIPQVNPRDIVQVFFDYLTENEQEPPHIKALRHLNDYFNVHASNFFRNDNDLRPNRDIYGYTSEDDEYIDVIPKVVIDALKAGQFSNAVIDDFIKEGVIIPGKDRKTFRITLKSDRTQPTVYRFNKIKMAELLN